MTMFKSALLVTAATALLTAGAAAAQNYNLTPAYGTANLRSGFQPDPHRRNLQSGGPISAAERSGGDCQGWIADAPDYRVNFTAGNNNLPLVFSADAQADTTLVINAPDGRWYCDDDGGNGGLNPAYTFRNPQSGQYDVWVGTYANAELQPASLSVSELYSD